MKNFSYYLPTRIIFGTGQLENLAQHIEDNLPTKQKILLVTGRHSLKKTGTTDRLLKILKDFTVILFDKVSPNPTSQAVNEGIEKFKKHQCDLIIGVGGGSVLDTAKAIAILTNNAGTLEDYQKGKKPENDPQDFIAVPTTAGTSSEMTIWSVITNLEGQYKNSKKSFSDEKMYPAFALIDPQLTYTLPKDQTASTGLDALAHAVEGYWSKRNNPLSNIYALEAIKLVISNLPKALEQPTDQKARENMSFAALLAGLAFSNSRTNSPHKISYPLTSHYNLPHGAACAITIPYFLQYIGQHKPEAVEGITQCLGLKDHTETANFLKSFIKKVGMPNCLSDLGIDEGDLPFIAKNSYVPIEKQADPHPIPYEDYLSILNKAL